MCALINVKYEDQIKHVSDKNMFNFWVPNVDETTIVNSTPTIDGPNTTDKRPIISPIAIIFSFSTQVVSQNIDSIQRNKQLAGLAKKNETYFELGPYFHILLIMAIVYQSRRELRRKREGSWNCRAIKLNERDHRSPSSTSARVCPC